MKNVLNLAVLLLMVSEVKAADGFDVKVSNDRTLIVQLEKGEKGAILSFLGKDGEVLFKDSLLLNDVYRKTFNLEVIPNGVYYLSLEKENSILTTEVTKTSAGLELTGKSSKIIFKPRFKVEKDLVRVFLTNPAKTEASFKVYDRGGTLLDTVLYKDLVVSKTFDFSKLPNGMYYITVKVDGRSFYKEIEIL